MFGSVGPTQFDLYFPLGGIPVRVNPTFWLMAVLMGGGLLDSGRFDLLVVWILVLFFSILIHELGHAVMARYFGWPPRIFLYHFGGLAVYEPYRGHTMGRSIAVSLAGPVAGFLFFGVVWATDYLLAQQRVRLPDQAYFAFLQLEWVNLWWGLVNLLPVLPLDGGRITEALCNRYSRRNGEELAAKIGMVVAGAVAAFFLMQRDRFGFYPGIMFLILAVQNYQTLDSYRGGRRW